MEHTDIEVLMPSSFLSQCVKDILIDGGNFVYSDIQPTRYFKENGTFKWSEISCLLGNIEDEFDIHTQSHEWFMTTVSKLWPLFLETVSILEGGELHTLDEFWNLCAWTDKQDEFKQQYQRLFSQGETTCVFEVILLITAVLEHSLRKIYLLKGINVPFLLRDLLSSQEVKSTIGPIPVVFMQILFGTPLCLNLRNIVWHGFPSPDELKLHFATVLIVLVASLGEVLQKEGIHISNLPSKSQVVNLHQLSSTLDGWFPDLTIYHKQAVNVFRNCHFIAPCHKVTWEMILQHYIDARYGQSLALLLPHMEQMLRCVFCWANNCSQRMLTAQTTEFYTTFDEILAENIPSDGDGINAIRQVLGDCILEMLLDMFTHNAGPRIRDKLSHGEYEFEHLPKILVNHIICISLAIVHKLEKTISKTACASGKELKEKITKASEIYVSKFHPVAVLKRTITDNVKILEAWKTIPQPSPTEVTFLQWDEYFKSCDSFLELRSILCNRVIIPGKNITDKSWYDDLDSFVQRTKVETVYRPRSETTCISLLRRIVDNLIVVCTQICNVLQEKYNHYNTHKLRSRQRRTYCQILSTCPRLYVAVQCVIILVLIQLFRINTVEILNMLQYSNLSRFLKDILKYAENLVSCTNLEKNRWDMVQMLTTHFHQRVEQAIQSKVV